MKTLTADQVKELTELLAIVWKGDKHMINHCLKSGKYIYLNGRYIDCCDSKPAIHSTLWYDDETEGPDKNYLSFERYNMMNSPDLLNANKFNYFFGEHYYSADTGIKLANIHAYHFYEDRIPENLIPITADEVKAINEAIQEVRTDYINRLKMYYKKYSHKVSVSGYWANR
jgi:hypothetical protein